MNPLLAPKLLLSDFSKKKLIQCPDCKMVREVVSHSNRREERPCHPCTVKRRRRTTCSVCGKPEIYKHGKSYNAVTLCKECFIKWRKRKFKKTYIKVTVKCPNCGQKRQIKIERYQLKTFAREKLCIGCANKRGIKSFKLIHIKQCIGCGEFFFTKNNRAKYCKVSCRKNHTHCVDCGAPCKDVKHKSTHPVCDLCMYERRRRYKDRKKYGDDWQTIKNIRLIKMITFVGFKKMKGEMKWYQKQRIWRKKLVQLGLNL